MTGSLALLNQSDGNSSLLLSAYDPPKTLSFSICFGFSFRRKLGFKSLASWCALPVDIILVGGSNH